MLLAVLGSALLFSLPSEIGRDPTSLFFKCELSSGTDAEMHVFQLTYFSEPPAPAQKLNYFDPDHLLPGDVTARGLTRADIWPNSFLLSVGQPSPDQLPRAAIVFVPRVAEEGTAMVRLDRFDVESDVEPSHYEGVCAVTEGAAAESEYLELLRQ